MSSAMNVVRNIGGRLSSAPPGDSVLRTIIVSIRRTKGAGRFRASAALLSKGRTCHSIPLRLRAFAARLLPQGLCGH